MTRRPRWSRIRERFTKPRVEKTSDQDYLFAHLLRNLESA